MESQTQPPAPSLSALLKLAVDALTYALRMPREWPAPRQEPHGELEGHPRRAPL
jgi:hypothetical protein